VGFTSVLRVQSAVLCIIGSYPHSLSADHGCLAVSGRSHGCSFEWRVSQRDMPNQLPRYDFRLVADFFGPILRVAKGETVEALTRFLTTTIRDQGASFIVASGGLIDAYCLDGEPGASPVFGQIELFRSIIVKSPTPLYLSLGNHDIECYRYKEGAT